MISTIFWGALLSFLTTFAITPFLIKTLKKHDMVGTDIHKTSKPVCAEMGGVAILLGFSVGYFLVRLLVSDITLSSVCVFVTIVLVGCIGVLDDLFNLRQRYKPLLTALVAFPLILPFLGQKELWFPLIGPIFLGSYYLIFIPLGVATASNMTNMFAGFNGLESGVGAISCFVLGVANLFYGNQEACLIAFPLSAAFLAFLGYNWVPAKIFPGDTGTLLSGAAIAALSIWGRVEFVGICLIAPSAIDFTLKMISRHPFSHRSRFGDTAVDDDNVLIPPRYPALAHAFLRLARLKEHELVSSLLLMQTLYAVLGILLMGLRA